MSAPVPSATPLRSDFPDWLSPMLVKELRQGMRTRVFVFTFILLQILMTLNVVIGLLSTSNNLDPGATSAIFWVMVGLPLLLILPMSGLGALSNERSGNTLELIFLTRLSAWRIVLGKWFAIVAQIALFACAVLPYAVLRYFMGSVNLTDDLLGLLAMLAGAAVLTSITVGVSPFQTRATRVLSTIGIVFLLQFLIPWMLVMTLKPGVVSGGAGGFPIWQTGVTLLLFGGVLIVLMLEIAAGKIAPAAENHSAAKRALGLGFLFIAIVMIAVGAQPESTLYLALICCIPVLIGAVGDPVRLNRGVYRPFLRRGVPGRILGRLFYPGWPAGAIYAVLLLAGFGALLLHYRLLDDLRAQLVFIAGVGALFFPALVTRLFFRQTGSPLGVFVAVAATCAVLEILGSIVDTIFNLKLRIGLCALPPCGFLESAL
ncbi:MAG TPA: hypothetical protein VNB29_02220, partial [Chthoniobacterales bacterium]|nr:hypothetical protein [Chthoniobacterales bacterium]